MKTDSVVCDDLTLVEKLHSVENAESTLLDHVESCVQCQHRLREAAADEDDWKKASSALQLDHKSDSPFYQTHSSSPMEPLFGKVVRWSGTRRWPNRSLSRQHTPNCWGD